jgi:hypothetical protein
MEKATTEIGRTWLRALRLLRYVYSDDNETATRKALAQVGKLLAEEPGFQSMFATARKPKSVASVLYSINFTGEMKEARLVIHRTESGGFIPVLRCPNMKTAMFVFAAFGGAETCLNCQKLFAVDAVRPDGSSSDRYCTAGCGQRYRQKLYRLRKKARAKRPSRRKGQKP